jgi:hypothetical protein
VRSPVAILTLLCLVTVVAGQAAWAKPGKGKRRVGSTEVETPWSKGVPREDQERALELFREGNTLFEQARYTEAVEVYERALASWDHPNIRFNMAFCLINMRQPLAAWTHLKQALRFGEAPLGERLHSEAMRALAVLEASLAQLTVRASQPDIRVMVDGRQVLDGPGEHTMKLMAGKHQLVASRAGYVTDSRALDLPAGRPVTEHISLAREKVRVLRENYERRWAWWVPWSVAGSSLVLGVAGGGLYLSARSDIRDYDRTLAAMCPSGCTDEQIPQSLEHQRTGARQRSGVAIGLWGAAGALLVTGGVMAILNRPHRQELRTAMPSVTVTPDYVGVGLSFGLE